MQPTPAKCGKNKTGARRGKTRTGAKRGKAWNRCYVRGNEKTAPSAGKHATGGKRGKKPAGIFPSLAKACFFRAWQRLLCYFGLLRVLIGMLFKALISFLLIGQCAEFIWPRLSRQSFEHRLITNAILVCSLPTQWLWALMDFLPRSAAWAGSNGPWSVWWASCWFLSHFRPSSWRSLV